jgi:nucleoside-diphosphate-sugar epimerase
MIRWITDHLGTAAWESVASVSDIALLDVRGLVDKEGNRPDVIRSKIEQGIQAIAAGSKVVVACDYGISRSNAVAAGILAVQEQIPFQAGLRLVMDRIGEKAIKIEMMHDVAAAVDLMQSREAEKPRPGTRIIVTGGSGYVGRTLVPFLQKSIPTIALSRNEADLVAGAVELDLLVQEHHATHIVHLAAPRDFGKNSALGDSVSMLKNVLDVCSANKLRLVFVSSADVFSGYADDPIQALENLAPLPRNSPGVAKCLCEIMIRQHAAVRCLSWVILRSAVIYAGSARRPKFLHTFIEQMLHSENVIVHRYRNGDPVVDLLHIDDFCRAVRAVVLHDACGIVHCGPGQGITTRKLVDLIQTLAHSRCAVSVNTIDTNTPRIVLDCAMTSATIGWQPQVTLSAGLKTLIDEMRLRRERNRYEQ